MAASFGSADETFRPGETCPASGLYEDAAGERQIALSKGDRFPPTRRGGTWHLVQITKDPDAPEAD